MLGQPAEYEYQGDEFVAAQVGANPCLRPQGQWVVYSPGPDMRLSYGDWFLFGYEVLHSMQPFGDLITWGALYDPTNGTMSVGDIVRMGP